MFMPPFFDHRNPFRREPYFPPHQSNNDTTQAPDFDIFEFMLFTSAMLSLSLLLAFFKVYCLDRRAAHLGQEGQPLNEVELAQFRHGYGAV